MLAPQLSLHLLCMLSLLKHAVLQSLDLALQLLCLFLTAFQVCLQALLAL